MADWFKFYENDLDETRLQYAVAQLPEVIPVWVGILSEACRHKVGTVSWGSDEIELFGFSKRLGLSIPKVNEAINMLVRIRYISKDAETITIIKWDEKQSEYCQKRTKQQNQTGEKHHTKKPTVGTVSGQCRDSVGQEESRGDRGDIIPTPPLCADGNLPTWEDVKIEADIRGIPEASAKTFFDHHHGNNLWLNEHGRLKNWRHKLTTWATNDRQPKPIQKSHATHRPTAPDRNAGTYNNKPLSAAALAKVL